MLESALVVLRPTPADWEALCESPPIRSSGKCIRRMTSGRNRCSRAYFDAGIASGRALTIDRATGTVINKSRFDNWDKRPARSNQLDPIWPAPIGRRL